MVFFCTNAAADKYSLKIKLDDCQPDGMINAWKERADHKDFWITQDVVLERDIETFYLQDRLDECRYISEKPERANCIMYHKNKLKSALRCKEHTKLMCRQYGGYC
jgi:hypothetical protein